MAITDAASAAVVVGVDGSDASLAAVRWAATQAALEARPLTLIHAATWNSPKADVDLRAVAAALHAEAQTVVRQACAAVKDLLPEARLRSAAVVGDPRSVLIEASNHAFLLVVGSRGRGPVKSLVLGSVGTAVTQHASCPVVVRRPHEEGTGGRGVLVGTDGLRASEAAVEWAYHHAGLRQMPLTLVRTVLTGQSVAPIAPEESGHEVLWAQLDEVARRFGRRHPHVHTHLRVVRGLPEEALAHAASGMDLVVAGRHVRRSVVRLLDHDVATRLVENAPCYVAVVPGRR